MDVTERMREMAMELNVPIIGFADTDSWDTDPMISANVPPERRPKAIMPKARAAIVLGMPVQRTVLDTAPSVYYNELYKTVNSLLDMTAQRFVNALDMLGYKAAYIPRDGYQGIRALQNDPSSFFSHKHAAYLAGLGTFGINNTILTERYGPRVRFTTILTNAPLECGRPMDRQLCVECYRCMYECPVKAIGDMIYPKSRIDKVKCTNNSAALNSRGISPCGRCIAVCPVGEDRMEGPTDEAIASIRKHIIP